MGKYTGVSIFTYTAADRVSCTLLLTEIDMSACVYLCACVHECIVCTLTHCVHTMCVCTFLHVSLYFPPYWDRVSLCCASWWLTHKHRGILLSPCISLRIQAPVYLGAWLDISSGGEVDERQVLMLMQQVFLPT